MSTAVPTFQALYDAFKAEVQSRRPDLTDWNEGSVLDAVGGASSMLADESMRFFLGLFGALFFDTAVGDDLDRLALDRLGLVRKPATSATGSVTWTKGISGAAYTIPAGTSVRGVIADGTSYTATVLYDVAIRADQAAVAVAVEADTLGRSSNLAAGVLDEIASPLVADPTASITNGEALAGGADEETDAAFRDRVRRYYSTLRRGTVGALETGALSVPGVAYVSVDESSIEDDGIVRVYVGDPDARSNDALATLVGAELLHWRAAGVMVEVLGSSRDEVTLTLALEVEHGADLVSLGAAVRAAVVGYGDELAPNRPARVSRVVKAMHEASALVLSARVTSHTDDIDPAAVHQAVRFVASTIAIAFTEVDP